ncbi:unnamed protein product [Spirodela intermedia]|uniref:FYVE-type domain-containing protein n=1 Tax=Spirodela intermedia TaxID=51605 RepID=A0A7I8JJC6_SPIIN|nr:unnamed protein product [Spirodela intermedia]CAA6669885.1 unnamed protein product [Spirodela intermedia]
MTRFEPSPKAYPKLRGFRFPLQSSLIRGNNRKGKDAGEDWIAGKALDAWGDWVVDASHCQGCSSQFSFISRKHHCRRCGGIFCNSCTQQRMTLRGQGDAPVRICDPCKKLEDAARFELRHGHKNRTMKEAFSQTPGTEENLSSSSLREPRSDMATGIASSSKPPNEAATSESNGDALKGGNILNEMESKSPEELRQQAVEEKKKHRILKGEGKHEEALQAFKRGKELERQAQALDIALRKSRRKSSASTNSVISQDKNDSSEGLTDKRNPISQSRKPVKDDLVSELRDLGWTDGDLHDSDKKPENLSLEGELSSIIKEVLPKASARKGPSAIDNSQVLAHKKKALMLKREGKLAEAKEELKKAKVLEKELEEQALLGQADDSDDELSTLVRSLDDHKQDDPLADFGPNLLTNFDPISVPDDLVLDDNFDVNDDDMNDPDMAAALKSFGWSEEDDHAEEDGTVSLPSRRESPQSEVLRLKKEALNQKRAAKQLEKDLEIAQNEPPASHSRSQPISDVNDKIVTEIKDPEFRPKPKSKLLIQRELLALKKKALALRREGRVDEADEELSKGKDLELQLQEMENPPNLAPAKLEGIKKNQHQSFAPLDVSASFAVDEEPEATPEVTENDMDDPALLSVLKNLGWTEEDVVAVSSTGGSSGKASDQLTEETCPPASVPKVQRSKAEIQREILAIKRRALAFRRQGKTQEAEEELERAKPLEEHIQAMEESKVPKNEVTQEEAHDVGLERGEASSRSALPLPDVSTPGTSKPESPPVAALVGSQHNQRDPEGISSSQSGKHSVMNPVPDSEDNPSPSLESLDDQIRARKRKAVALKREGKLAEAREELRQAKLMEKGLEEGKRGQVVEAGQSSSSTSTSSPSVVFERKPLSGRDRFKLQQESLAHKRQALRLRREGKIEESEAEFELAKSLEAQLEEMDNSKSLTNKNGAQADDSVVEDFLDPQLMSALRSIGWEESDIKTSSKKVNIISPEKSEAKIALPKDVAAYPERAKLEEQINSEKRRALNLKRAGKQAEALEALRSAKSLEKKLMSLG